VYFMAFGLMPLALAAVVYSQYRLPYHIANSAQLWSVRATLIAVGLGFAWVTHQSYQLEGALQWVVLITSFSITHVPSACILFLKCKRREQL